MRRLLIALGALVMTATITRAEIRTQTVEYHDGDTVCRGFLAYDDATADPRPGVLVCPEWWGLNDYPKQRATMLAKLGYVAFVADIYGHGKTTEDPAEAGKLATPFNSDRKLMRTRTMAALDTLAGRKEVDRGKMAAIGYCFGGACALELARAGAPVVGVVSFHGSVGRTADEGPDAIKAKILVCHGGADPLVPPAALAAFEEEMRVGKANYQINIYGGAQHAFTNPAADSHHIPGIKYDESADKRSWAAARSFFDEIFAKL